MGCDYYVVTALEIKFKDEKKETKTKTIENQGAYLMHFDEDNETYKEAMAREMAEREKQNPPKVLYDNGWKIKHHSHYDMYLTKVDLDQVSTITKITYCYER